MSERGWSRDDLKKLAGLNFIRVFKDVERFRDKLENWEPFEDNIEYESLDTEQIRDCRTDVDFYKGKGSDILDEVPLIDGHNDFPYSLYENEKNQLKNFDFNSDLRLNPKWKDMPNTHTDLPRLREGKLGGQFWVAYVGCSNNFKDAVERTVEQIDVIKRLIKKYPKDLKFVGTADGIMDAFQERKIASMIQVEGGHSIDSRLAVLRLYYELGVRAMTLTHSCDIPWADASPIDNSLRPKKNLTDWGKV